MVEITIIQTKGFPSAEFEVTVKSELTTKHKVFLSEDYYQHMCSGELEPSGLVKKSFEFLLEREPNSSILREFELQLINNYFPDFERTIAD